VNVIGGDKLEKKIAEMKTEIMALWQPETIGMALLKTEIKGSA
jgi:hypothetical protein